MIATRYWLPTELLQASFKPLQSSIVGPDDAPLFAASFEANDDHEIPSWWVAIRSRASGVSQIKLYDKPLSFKILEPNRNSGSSFHELQIVLSNGKTKRFYLTLSADGEYQFGKIYNSILDQYEIDHWKIEVTAPLIKKNYEWSQDLKDDAFLLLMDKKSGFKIYDRESNAFIFEEEIRAHIPHTQVRLSNEGKYIVFYDSVSHWVTLAQIKERALTLLWRKKASDKIADVSIQVSGEHGLLNFINLDGSLHQSRFEFPVLKVSSDSNGNVQ